MCGRATLAIEVSSTSMKAAIATVAAMIHGLNFGFHCCSMGAVGISYSEFGSGAVEVCPEGKITVASPHLDMLERFTPDSAFSYEPCPHCEEGSSRRHGSSFSVSGLSAVPISRETPVLLPPKGIYPSCRPFL